MFITCVKGTPLKIVPAAKAMLCITLLSGGKSYERKLKLFFW
jgi:hypothetical protein